MRNHRFRRQTNRIGIFAGITAHAVRATAPPANAAAIGDRLFLDTSRVTDGFRGTPLTLSPDEISWLKIGLRRVAADIACAERVDCVIIAIDALEILEVDYIEAALAPAIAGWAAEEFGFTKHPADVRLDDETDRYVVDWAR